MAEYLPGMQKALSSIPVCLLITSIDVFHHFLALPLSALSPVSSVCVCSQVPTEQSEMELLVADALVGGRVVYSIHVGKTPLEKPRHE